MKLCFTDSEIVGDGNCFYRCISVYFFGHQNEHSKIRQNINRYMLGDGCMSEAENEERSRRYRQFMLNTPQSYEDYLRYFMILSKLNQIIKSCGYTDDSEL